MEYNELIELVKSISPYIGTELEYKSLSSWYISDKDQKKLNDKGPYFFYVKAYVGGIRGGSCYGNEGQHHESNEEGFTEAQDEFDKVIDEILMKVRPSISLLEYRKFIRDINVEEFTQDDGSDYYGNTSEYLHKCVKFEDLYKAIKDW
jgi:hypothetical protein